MLRRRFEGIGAAQDDRSAVREVNTTTRSLTGRQAAAEVLAENQLCRVSGRQLSAVDRDQWAG